MPAIRCETCKGTGKVMKNFYVATDKYERYEDHPVTCEDCGGSGCKWSNHVDPEDSLFG